MRHAVDDVTPVAARIRVVSPVSGGPDDAEGVGSAVLPRKE